MGRSFFRFNASILRCSSLALAVLIYAAHVNDDNGSPRTPLRLIVAQTVSLTGRDANSRKASHSNKRIDDSAVSKAQTILPSKRIHLNARHDDDDGPMPNANAKEKEKAEASNSKQFMESYMKRYRITLMVFILTVLVLSACVETFFRFVTRRVAKSKDVNLKILEQQVTMQVACIFLVTAMFEMLSHSQWLRETLELRWFEDYHRVSIMNRPTWKSIQSIFYIDNVIDFVLTVTLNFSLIYLISVLLLTAVSSRLHRWLHNAECLDLCNSVSSNIHSKRSLEYLCFRYDFEDATNQRTFPGLDPAGSYFQDYFKACYYHLTADLIVISAPMMFLLLSLLLPVTLAGFFLDLRIFPLFQGWVLITLQGLSGAAVVFMFLIYRTSNSIKLKLLPRDLHKYLWSRIALEKFDSDERPNPFGTDSAIPQYLLNEKTRKSWLPNRLAAVIYGTSLPNAHEYLFPCWRRWPSFVVLVCQLCMFLQIFCPAYSWTLIFRVPVPAKSAYTLAALSTGALFFILHWILFPFLMWNLVIVTCTHGLVKSDILQEVWETQRAITLQRLRALINCLRCEGTLFSVECADDKTRAGWVRRMNQDAPSIIKHRETTFTKLGPDSSGVLRGNQLYRFCQTGAAPLFSDADLQRWIKAFDTKQNNGLDLQDFCVFAWNVKNMMECQLDIKAVEGFFEKKLKLKMNDSVDVPSLKSLFTSWNLTWKERDIIHLFEYSSGKRGTTSMSVQHFVNSLSRLESKSVNTLRDAVRNLSTAPETLFN